MIRTWLNLHIKKQQGFIFPGPSSLVGVFNPLEI